MSRLKQIKTALIMSIVSLIVCCSMLIGSTFAWFTDTVTSGANRIIAGNLDVAMEYAVLDDTGGFVEWRDANGANSLFTGNLWEPGHTEVVYLRITNAGSLALKYQFAMSISETEAISVVTGKAFKLSDYIKYGITEVNGETGAYANADEAVEAVKSTALPLANYSRSGRLLNAGDNAYLALVVFMPDDVPNEANYDSKNSAAPDIDMGITLVATQDVKESDSFGSDYDAGATYSVMDLSELESAFDNAKDGDTIELLGDIKLENELVIDNDITINGMGNTLITEKPVHIGSDNNVTILNTDFSKPVNDNNNASSIYASGLSGKLVIDGCSFTDVAWEPVQITPVAGAEIVITNNTFDSSDDMKHNHVSGSIITEHDGVHRYVHIEVTDTSTDISQIKVKLTDNTFTNIDNCDDDGITIYGVPEANMDLGSNVFTEEGFESEVWISDGLSYNMVDPSKLL